MNFNKFGKENDEDLQPTINTYFCNVKVEDWIMDDEGYYKAEIPVEGLREKNRVTVHTMDDAMMDHCGDRKAVNKALRQILELGYFFVFTNDDSITCRWRFAYKPDCAIYFRLEEEVLPDIKLTFFQKVKLLFGKQKKEEDK